jgi:hypothetical protein
MLKLRTLVLGSFLFALFPFCAPFAFMYSGVSISNYGLVGRWLNLHLEYIPIIWLLIWVTLLVVAIKKHPRRGWWLLAGLPLAGFWVAVEIAVVMKVKLIDAVKFQQRYQMRNRILSKAVPALEFRLFATPKNCVHLVRQFWGLIPTASCSFSSDKSYSPPFLKLHIFQGCAEECRYFRPRVAGNGFAAVRKSSIRRPPAETRIGLSR